MQQSFTVTGMTCGHCEQAVRQVLLQVDPHAVVLIDRALQQVQVTSLLPREALAGAIREEGYTVVN